MPEGNHIGAAGREKSADLRAQSRVDYSAFGSARLERRRGLARLMHAPPIETLKQR